MPSEVEDIEAKINDCYEKLAIHRRLGGTDTPMYNLYRDLLEKYMEEKRVASGLWSIYEEVVAPDSCEAEDELTVDMTAAPSVIASTTDCWVWHERGGYRGEGEIGGAFYNQFKECANITLKSEDYVGWDYVPFLKIILRQWGRATPKEAKTLITDYNAILPSGKLYNHFRVFVRDLKAGAYPDLIV